MAWNLETALESARDADHWLLDARFGGSPLATPITGFWTPGSATTSVLWVKAT
jgi:hypothetical protein